MIGLSLSLSLGSTGGSGATPTPTPTPGVATNIFYDDTDSAFEVTNPEVITTSSAWRVLEAGADPASGDSAISGQTTTSLAITEISVGQGAYHVPDGDWSRHSNVLYRLPAIPDPTVTHYPSAGQTDGNDLTDYGWTAFNKPALMSVSSGLWTITQNYSNEGGWSIDLSTTAHAVELVHAYLNTTDETNFFDLGVRFADKNNYIKLSGTFLASGYNLKAVVAGVETYLMDGTGNNVFGNHVDGCSIKAVVRGNIVYIYEDGVLVPADPDATYRTPDGGYDISSFTALAGNTKVAVVQLGGNTLGQAVAKDIVTTAFSAAPISLTTTDWTAPLAASNFIKLNAVGTTPVGVTTMNLGWIDENSQPIYITTGLAASSGAFDVADIATPHILRGRAARLIFWKSSDSSVYGYSDLPSIPAYQLVGPTLIGPNFSLWGSIAGDYCRDRGLTAEFFDASGGHDIPKNADGWPTDTPNVGAYYDVLFFQSDKDHRSGEYTITWPAGVSASNAYGENCTYSSIDNTNHTMTVTLADETSSVVFSLRFTPTPGSVPGGVVLTCLPTADANPTYPVTDQCMADWSIDQGFRHVRLMKQLGAEMGNNQLEADKFTVIKPRYMTPQYLAFLILDMGLCPWLSFAIVETEAYITGLLTDLKAELISRGGIPAWLRIIVEWGNEIWNWGTYQNQDHRAHWMAADRGFVPGVTVGEQGNVIYDFTPGSTLSAQTLETGDVVYYDGYKCARAKQHVSIGAQYPASSADDDANFEFISSISTTHVHKMQGAAQANLASITKPIFDDGVVLSALGIFLDDSIDDAWERISDDSNWKSVDIIAPSGYLANLTNFGDHDFDDDYETPATYATGLIDYLTNDTSLGIPGIMDKLLNLKHGLEDRICKSPDYTPGDATPSLGTYELNSHFGYVTNPPDETALTTAMNYASKSDDWATMLTTYWNRIVSEIGGLHTPFCDVEARPTHFSTQWQMFGFLDNSTGARRSEQKPWAATSTIALAQLP